MKKIFLSVLFLALSAFGEVKSFVINDLILLEMPGKMIKSGALDLNSEQMIRISKEVQPLMHESYQSKINEAFGLEKRVQKLLLQGKSKEDVKVYLDQIAVIKREAIDIKIDAYKAFQAILTPDQWQKYVELSQAKR
ncbi:MAG: hypothetical protein RBR12_09045 [Sulfurospirillum cavolei]|nr:hypothetical protein [Sulfurospirillum cavolei]